MAVSTISVNESQLKRLLSGMLGSISELKTYPMLQARLDVDGSMRRSSVPGFDRTLLHLFPEIEEEVEDSLDVAERMLMLKRRMDERIAEAVAERSSRLSRSNARVGGVSAASYYKLAKMDDILKRSVR